MIDDVDFFSGGIMSWALAKRVADKYSTDGTRLRLLFTDTKIEHEDLYRFLHEAAENVGGELIIIADGRTPWEVFKDERMLGNTRADPCSKILKRELSKKWVYDNYPDPDTVRLWIGMNWDEEHRLKRSMMYWAPYQVGSLLLDSPWMIPKDYLRILQEKHGIEPPLLYKLGFPHNNCGGGCVKAGQAHFRHLLEVLPETYAEWERNEEEMRQYLGKDISILRDRTGGTTTPLTLKQLRQRGEDQCNMFEWGGCGCFGDMPDEELSGEA